MLKSGQNQKLKGDLYDWKAILLLLVFSIVLAFGTLVYIDSGGAAPLASASGLFDGLDPDAGKVNRRQFSFSALTSSDGTVRGTAVLHNPADDGAHGNQPYGLLVDVSCMKVIGNIAFFGGTAPRMTDPSLVDAVYFSIQDNGEPGAGSNKISPAIFFDDDPNTTGDPQL